VANAFAESQPEFSPGFDLYLYLANVKMHLADHSPMDQGDMHAWCIADAIQEWDDQFRGNIPW
jgi:hypothetical protein